jgi:uncharacterized protein YdeI (YjbR/CyaY-like superfamily)
VGLDDLDQVLVTSRQEWRVWLDANADTSPGVWVVTWKRTTGRASPSYDELVEECLCFGWIDSTVRTRDPETGMQLMTPRKPGSTWAATNKARVERLMAAGLMAERGLRVIELAKANGSWTILDTVERLEVPDDLAAALDAVPDARSFFDSMPPSARKQHLYFVISAKRPETRAGRIAKIVAAADEGRRTG